MKAMPLAAVVLLAATLPSTGLAQDDGGFVVGARGGPNFSDLAGDLNFDSRVGFGVGVFGGLQLGKFWSVQAELSYQQKGAKDIAIQIPVRERRIKISYLELQLPLALYPDLGPSGLTLRLYGGPYGAIEVACSKEVDDAAGTPVSSDCEAGPEAEAVLLKSVDYGIVIGAGVDLAGRDRSGLTLDVRYDVGLANINDGGVGDVMNRAIQVVVGYAHR
ncbi:MAG: PorT family protein [Gemmatimonadetes bacterium]|uniref:PorT family protein n=1 Tax=Candidatus Kutchimonas denitrificans TaxID=3056748 RepID=A0AAE4ZCP5_9BACT|nr:PorT family protein [Gemmatimonadota bacterium]NIR76091.1 PorT family protein [Candidatus Kutchimonas denitrificans]NIS00470.1 PorT family protein [Gemmatimonadota bacterium]NIT66128.1 PorT family protein [Gemmatimonadota bacterium]NIU54206.1 outer membrane beta-barrel protein [Gemmatimonadota bacterium]